METHYSIVPLFHYSMIEAKTHASKNTLYFHSVVENPRRLGLNLSPVHLLKEFFGRGNRAVAF